MKQALILATWLLCASFLPLGETVDQVLVQLYGISWKRTIPFYSMVSVPLLFNPPWYIRKILSTRSLSKSHVETSSGDWSVHFHISEIWTAITYFIIVATCVFPNLVGSFTRGDGRDFFFQKMEIIHRKIQEEMLTYGIKAIISIKVQYLIITLTSYLSWTHTHKKKTEKKQSV